MAFFVYVFMAHSIALVDFSYIMYKSRFHYKSMARCDASGALFPIGHIYGVFGLIQQLSSQFKAVILCVDSHAPHRYEALPEYKSGRHVATGNPFEDYNIMNDLGGLLGLCTYLKNVFYIKHAGMESDDIIASWIATAGDKWDLHCYFNDNDILQTKGDYHWHQSFDKPEVDRRTYINDKYGINLDYLPIWYKVVRGDSSDHIPVSIFRFPTKKLISICEASENDCFSIGWFYEAAGLITKDGKITNKDAAEAVSRNLRVVSPRILDVSEFKLARFNLTREEGMELLSFYQINNFVLEV